MDIIQIPTTQTPGAGLGDVVGPASSTDNAIVRYDTTTGRLLQNSNVTIADSTGAIAGASSLTSPAATPLTLGLGTGGTALTLASSTLAATFAGTTKSTATATTLAGGLWSESGTPRIALSRTGSTANQGLWDLLGGGDGVLNFRCLPDADNAQVIWLSVTRVGTAITSADFRGILTSGTSTTAASILGTSLGLTENLNVGGVIKIADTTAASSNAGALIVQGGISAGNTGAASYFGGAVTVNGTQTNLGGAVFTTTNNVNIRGTNAGIAIYNSVAGSSNNWSTIRNTATGSDSNLIFSTNTVPALTLDGSANATFAGAVAIGNTTAVSVAAPSTHKVSILIGGVQYYLLASNV